MLGQGKKKGKDKTVGAVQNEAATVENLKTTVKNKVAEKTLKTVFKRVVEIDNIKNIINDIIECIQKDLKEKSFMTLDLELTDQQREALQKNLPTMIIKVKDDYIKNIETDKRLKEVSNIVKYNLANLADEVLSSIGKEVNRGAVISSTAVSADTKNKEVNKIELNHSKIAGDITIPSQGIFISTNCIDIINNTITETDPKEK